MKKLFSGIMLFWVISANANSLDTVPKVSFANLTDSASYALGFNIGQTIKQRFGGVNQELLISAMKKAAAGEPCGFEENLLNMVINNYVTAETEKGAKAEKDAGIAFLAENKTKEGVKVTATGLQYKELRPGTGAKPKVTDVVKVHYEGRLISGKVFDASYPRGTPAEFPLNGVIAGWTEGLQFMTVGSKYQFYIPSELAYGNTGAGADIKPGSTLIFDVELLDIVKQAPPAQAAPASKPTTKPAAKPTAKPVAKPKAAVKKN